MATRYKEPWEMTKKQYTKFRDEGIDWRNKTAGPGVWGKMKWHKRTAELHRDSVWKAIARGRRISSSVLKDYPSLRSEVRGGR